MVITAVFLLITVLTLALARCMYRRFKATTISPSPLSNPWKLFHGMMTTRSDTAAQGDVAAYDQQYLDGLDGESRGEHEALLARRRSTSYYDANRSRAPVPVVIKYDNKGRPISTWSTASSVAAQRGEELTRWTQRRDDLIRIYGQSQTHSQRNSYMAESPVLYENEAEEASDEAVSDRPHVAVDHPSPSWKKTTLATEITLP
ncbi:hypothetical protein BGZ94_001525 [Podila epigama]|nr:hypothetical protein BGZ94_001525 [Podila epigama]